MGETLWSRRIADELWSGLVTPLTFSALAGPMSEHMVWRRLERAGFRPRDTGPVFRLIRGRVYVNASLVAEVMSQLPALLLSEGLLDLLPEDLRHGVRAAAPAFVAPGTLWIVASLALRERGWMPWTRAEAFREEAAAVAAELGSPPAGVPAEPGELRREIGSLRERLARYLEVVSWAMVYAYVFYHLTQRLLERWAPGEREALPRLVGGVAGIRTFEAHGELVAIARRTAADPELRELVLGARPEALAERLGEGRLGPLGEAVTRFLRRHGHRMIARDLSAPSWRERPAVVFATLQSLVRSPPDEPSEERSAARPALEERVRSEVGRGLGGTIRRELLSLSLGWCREYYAARENMRYHADYFLAALRRLALEAGSRLVRAGGLEAVADVFYLEAEELERALAALERGEPAPPELASRALARRRRYESDRGTPPEVVRGDAAAAEAAAGAAAGAGEGERLRGVGVSPGSVEAAARVVRDVAELQSLRRGEVVVAAATDPSWTSLLALAGGLVLEVGGLLSHGAIIARELGIPAVAEVAGATLRLATGDLVRVDGAAGTVERLAAADGARARSSLGGEPRGSAPGAPGGEADRERAGGLAGAPGQRWAGSRYSPKARR